MNYRILLRMKIQESNWLNMGESHDIPWDVRNLITASSGWAVLNQENVGLAFSCIPLLEKGIYELSQFRKAYEAYEIMYGLGTIHETLKFYENLLKDCKEYPYAELYGCVVA